MRGDRGFTIAELLIVVAIIGIIAAVAVPNLLRARMSGNEASAIGSLRAISAAQHTFASNCGGGGYAASLADLAKVPPDGVPFIAPDVGSASPGGTPKSGYVFTVSGAGDVVRPAASTCNGAAQATRTEFFGQADPVSAGVTGNRHFAVDQSGAMRQHTAPLTAITDGAPLQ